MYAALGPSAGSRFVEALGPEFILGLPFDLVTLTTIPIITRRLSPIT